MTDFKVGDLVRYDVDPESVYVVTNYDNKTVVSKRADRFNGPTYYFQFLDYITKVTPAEMTPATHEPPKPAPKNNDVYYIIFGTDKSAEGPFSDMIDVENYLQSKKYYFTPGEVYVTKLVDTKKISITIN